MRRVAPAIFLFFLSPFVAEWMLGDFPITYLPFIVVLAPMYGGGAILIRELVRRSGRGWPSIVLLALAYGVLEEGLTTMSLFNPDYAGAHLLDQGFVPALGIAVPWTIFVLTLHTVWSISVPIALTEEWTPRRSTPWLRTPGTVLAGLLFALGCFGTTMSSYGTGHYLAPWPKLLVVVIIVLILVAAAFLIPARQAREVATVDPVRRAGDTWEAAPVRRVEETRASSAVEFAGAPWARPNYEVGKGAPAASVVLASALAAGLLFGLTDWSPTWLGVAQMVVAPAGIAVAIGLWSQRAGWGSRQRLAAGAGGLLTYGWYEFGTHPVVGGGAVITPVSHVICALIALTLLFLEARSLRHRELAAPVAVEHPVVGRSVVGRSVVGQSSVEQSSVEQSGVE